MKLEENFSLTSFNTLAIPAIAQYFAEVKSQGDILSLMAIAKEKDLEVKVLGGGSNVVMSDDITGLVMKLVNQDCQVVVDDSVMVRVKVGAGYDWHQFVLHCLDQGWNGLENLSYIPGTVGAAPVQNIGAYGVEVKDFIYKVNGVYLDTGVAFSFLKSECDFEYRESIFKQALSGKTAITSVEFEFDKQAEVNVTYAPLNTMAEEQGLPSAKQLSNWVIDVRKSKLPDPKILPNAGSFFKNPVVGTSLFNELNSKFPGIPNYPQVEGVKLPAGWLIDNMGLKGQSYGSVSVHDKQALVLVNNGGTGKDVLDAAEEIKRRVKLHYNIDLEQEPRLFE